MLRRVHKWDRVIVLIGVPLWVVCFGLAVMSQWKPAAYAPLRVTLWPQAQTYPRIVGTAPFVDLEAQGVRVDDRVVRVGSRELLGASGLGFEAAFLAEGWQRNPVPLTLERAGRRFEVRVPQEWVRLVVPLLAITPLFVGFGLAILLKAPRSAAARSIFHLFLVASFVFSALFAGPGWIAWLSVFVSIAGAALVGPLVIRALLLFPNGVAPRGTFWRWVPLPFVATGLCVLAARMGFPYSIPRPAAEWIAGGVLLVSNAVFIALLVRIYQNSDALTLRRLKWSIYGLGLSCILSLFGAVLFALRPEETGLLAWLIASFGLVPICGYVALYRYDLFDVDRLISATATYNIALVALAGMGLFLAPRFGDAVTAWLEVPASTGQLAVSVGLALLIVPLQRRLHPRVEALFFRERHQLESDLDRLRDELEAPDAKTLLRCVGEALHERIRPESTVIYGRDGDHYAAVLVAGRGVTPELSADGPLIATLRQRREPVCRDGELAGRGVRAEDPFVRAALEVLNAAVVLPIVARDGEPTTFVVLGPKRSGDLYTGSEIRLLAALADRVALELQRFDREEVHEQSRAMQQAMRRYVPGAIAEQIERGGDLEASEREVSVLFVDIRGYSTLSQDSHAREVFSTVNRYTRLVSELVRETGGTVVEFNGDGMMAVFGAPNDLPEKERAAVKAARRIASEVGDLAHEGTPVSVGVGVATGLAYVGNIQAADRLIWSAIGNTTNLAARLQNLTRDLDVAVMIDATTHAALESEGRRFQRHEDMAIRGLRERIDVFSLDFSLDTPRAAAPAA